MKSLAEGRTRSTRQQLLRASNYYRFAILGMMSDDPQMRANGDKLYDLAERAGEIVDTAHESFEISFEGARMPGYFPRAANDVQPHKTLLMLNGGETFGEDLIFYIIPQAIERGYNFMPLDLPGLGMLPLVGRTFRPAMNLPIAKAVDILVARKDIDTSKLAVFGGSGGGGFAHQAAELDPRIKAVAMSSCVVDVERCWRP